MDRSIGALLLFDRLAQFILRRRLAAGVVLGLVVLSVSGGSALLQADFSVQAFFGSEDPALQRLRDFQDKQRWGPDDSILLVTLEAADGDLVTPKRMTVLAELSRAIEASDGVAVVHSLASSPRLRSELPGMVDLSPLSESIPSEDSPPEPVGRWRTQLLEHPMLVPQLLARDGGAAAIAVELSVSSDDIQAMRPVVAQIRAVVQGFNGREGVQLRTAGVPAVRSDFFEVIFRDQFIMLPVIALLILTLLIAMFRRAHAVIAPVLAALIPPVMVFGAMGLTGEPLGILNQSYFTLLPVIAIADAIHMVSRFHEELRRRTAEGQTLDDELREAAIRKAVSRVGLACLLTSTTTTVGFLSLQAADMTVLRNFGLYAALGIVLAYGTVLLIIPLVLSFARTAPMRSGSEAGESLVDRALLSCANLSLRRPWRVLLVTALFLAGSLWMGTRVVVDNNLTAMLEPEHETSAANRLVDEQLGGILGAEIDIQGEPDALKDPDLLRALLDLENWATQHEIARSASSPASLIASLQQTLTGRREIPATRAEVAQLLLLAETMPELSEMLDLRDFSQGRMVIRTQDPGANEFLAFAEQIRDELAVRMEPFSGFATAHITGTPWVAYRGINNVTLDLRNSLAIAFVAVALIIFLLLRSPRLALLCLLPNALPLIAGYGLLGLCGWLLDPTPAVVFTVALGIAVDDTIHMLVRYREEFAGGRPHPDAIRLAVLHSGRPVVLTSVLLSAGFLVNILSSFPTMVVLGMLGAFVIQVAMWSDLFVLPALLTLFGESRGSRQ